MAEGIKPDWVDQGAFITSRHKAIFAKLFPWLVGVPLATILTYLVVTGL